jgi:predicted nucleic acid-binding protein
MRCSALRMLRVRKLKKPIRVGLAIKWVDRLCRAEFVPVGTTVIKAGIANAKPYQISYWDGAILAAAEALGATTVLSEDLNHGQIYGAVKVINPFLNT